MADNIFSILCSCACKYVGIDGVDQIVGWFSQHLSDHGQRLTKALTASNDKAWKALEVALAGESLLDKFARGEDRALRAQIAAYIGQLPMPELDGKQQYRKQILQNIRDARKSALIFGRLAPETLASRAGPMADRGNPQKVLAAEKQALLDMAAVLKEVKLIALAWLLEQQPQPGQSVLVVAARYYFQRHIEDDAELSRRLQFTAMENLSEAQQQGFQQLDAGLKLHAARVEQVLIDLAEIAEEIRGLAGDLRDSALDLRSEMERMRGENRDLYARVLQMLEQQNLHERPVHAGDSLSIRSDMERQRVKDFLARYRQLPEELKRESPALLNGLGKLQVATGDYQNAHESFTRVVELSPDARSRAEGHYNAYHAALEHAAVESGSYQIALAELKRALRYDPQRFAPFPLEDYDPLRILGAGGFGVTFLCKKRLTGSDVAVKALQADGLERDVGSVLQEASTLDQLAHPAIIRLRHCGYADPQARARPFIEMDYFESLTLEEFVHKNGALSVGNVLALARPVAEALHAAHGKGILHRDVKPANLLVRNPEGRWEVRVIDFGLALKQSLLGAAGSSSGSRRSMTGADVAGTRHYAAPEQMGELPGARIGTWSDVYGWAKTCCYALFQNTEPTYQDYKKIPEALSNLLGQCLARMPNERPSGFAEVLDKLGRIRPDPPKSSPQTPKAQPKTTPPVKPPPVQPEKIEILPITALEAGEQRLPSAIPVRPQAIPTGRSSSPRYPQAQLAPPTRFVPRRTDPAKAATAPGWAVAVIGMIALLVNGGAMFSLLGGRPTPRYEYTPSSSKEELSKDGLSDSSSSEIPQPAAVGNDYVTPSVVVLFLCALASIASTICGFLMLNRKMHTMSLVGCFLSMLPIGVCCLGGLPIGIWGVMTIMRPEVRSTFT
jgi:serine/threonine protein kinase